MLLRCHQPFGNFVPGDEVVVPEGVTFDHYYFRPVETEPGPDPVQEPVEDEDGEEPAEEDE